MQNVTTTIPYPGTAAVRGEWYFQDVVVYEKDKDSLKVTIRYAHDPKRDARVHVIMMSQDEKRFAQYDEIQLEDGSEL